MSGAIPKSCMDCPHHKVVQDPDPTDRFNDDDEAVLCTKKENETGSAPYSNHHYPWEFQSVTVSCRPHNKRKETSPPPDWCPLRPNPKKKEAKK